LISILFMFNQSHTMARGANDRRSQECIRRAVGLRAQSAPYASALDDAETPCCRA
jgi:hypothetical protein